MNPKSRTEDLVIQDLNEELFIYDLKTDKVYSLNPTSAFVWNNLDGETSVSDLARKTSKQYKQPVNEDLIWLAIDELRKFNLLEEEGLPKQMSKLKRREAIKRIGLATMIALPVISMLVAPTALQAASGGGTAAVCQPCTGTGQGNCAPGQGRCAINGDSPQTRICSNNTSNYLQPGNAYPPGRVLLGYTTQTDCARYGPDVCCRGSATFTAANGRCTCN